MKIRLIDTCHRHNLANEHFQLFNYFDCIKIYQNLIHNEHCIKRSLSVLKSCHHKSNVFRDLVAQKNGFFQFNTISIPVLSENICNKLHSVIFEESHRKNFSDIINLLFCGQYKYSYTLLPFRHITEFYVRVLIRQSNFHIALYNG